MDKKLHNKLQKVRAALKVAYVERDAAIDGMLVALIARLHVLLLGPPGTAKSALVTALTACIDGAKQFVYLMTKFTTPEEIFGPISIKGLEQDEVRRVIDGKLADVQTAFLDEVFKSNSAILNSLLTLMNERQYDNGRTRINAPLEIMVGASNEMPEGPELAAMYDRFSVRFWVEYIHDRDKLRALLMAPAGNPQVAERLTLDEIHQLQVEAAVMPLPGHIADLIMDLKTALAEKGIAASDRTWRQMVQVVKARAVLEGLDEPTEDCLEAMSDCLWREPEQRQIVAAVVGRMANPLTAEAVKLLDMAEAAFKTFPERIDTDSALATAARANQEVKQMLARGQKLLEGKNGQRTTRLHDALERIESIRCEMARRTTEATGL